MDKIPTNFSVRIYGEPTPVTDTISSARLGIFYRGVNRNSSYISEEFAEKLISTIAYCPVKGIYDKDNNDYTDHGKNRDEGRIYGVVPSETNFAWEKHEDEDGVERDYACVDVYLYTSLYKEAKEIVGKAQSMELYSPSVKGKWETVKGRRIFKFDEASFLGLQVLGDDVTPCFEGAAFFSKENPESIMVLSSLFNKITELEKELYAQNKGGEDMDEKEIVFKLSDRQKENKIFQALNKEEMRYFVLDVFEKDAIVFDMESESFLQVNYAKNDDTEEVTIEGEPVKVFAEYVTEQEKIALKTIRQVGGNFVDSLEKFESKDLKIKELEEDVSTLTTEKENFAKVEKERDTLLEFKQKTELKEKEGILAKYEKALDSDVIENFKTKLDDFTSVELEKELAFTLVKAADGVETIFNNSKEDKLFSSDDDDNDDNSIIAKLETYRDKRK